jgi:hypothetical protein
MEMSPSWEATNRSATKKFPKIGYHYYLHHIFRSPDIITLFLCDISGRMV